MPIFFITKFCLLPPYNLLNKISLYRDIYQSIGLILVKEEGRTGFSEGWQGCSEGNGEEQPYQPEENPILPDSFTWIYITFLIGFRIGLP